MRWLTNPVAQFLATGFVTLVVVILATSALSRSAADEEAVADARALTWVLGPSVAQPAIPAGPGGRRRGGDRPLRPHGARPAADRRRTPDQDLGGDGTVLYSDRTELIGMSYPLGDDELDVIE